MTHYPYFSQGTEQTYHSDERLNRYLNAIRIGDQALRNVVDHLEKTGQADSTLIVVLGDHGEAFGRHGNYIHASAVYEENVHVPLLLINKQLFNGETSETIGGIVDVAPTVFDLLELPFAGLWQGHSLFDTAQPRRVYFFSPWGGVRFGFREGDFKVIFDANTNAFEVYNLAVDPRETVNLASTEPERLAAAKHHLAAWVQYQRRLMASVTAPAG